MFSIPGYNIKETVFMNTAVTLLRAVRLSDEKVVLLKIPASEVSETSSIQTTNFELSIQSLFQSSLIIKASEKITLGSALFLEMENFEGESLEIFLQEHMLSLEDCLQIAIQLTGILELLHANQVLHGDLRPAHCLINPKRFEIALFDFTFAQKLEKGNTRSILERKLFIAPEYLSPEQTDRMDMKKDQRSDLYILGITLYKLFTGQLPFEHVDNNELVHAHIAKLPLSPLLVNQEIPPMLSDIILKLLKKKPEERYQSALGLKFDLKECLHQLAIHHHIEPFVPCRYEVTDEFKIPSCLYGRENEIKKVMEAFNSISTKSETILLQGCSGVGKSVFVQEVYHRLRKKNVLFLTGKCDQNNENIPFGIFTQALNGWVQQWNNQEDEKNVVPNTLVLLEPSMGVLAHVIPGLKLYMKEQPFSELPPVEAQKRLALSLLKFLETISTRRQPLVLFLDDLQWADSASLQFLQLLMESSESKNLLLICSYRNLHDQANCDLTETLQKAEKRSHIKQLHLSPLSIDNVSELLADTLGSHPTLTRPLADHFLMCTLGNPLFIHEKIHTLYKEGLFTFNEKQRSWNWALEDIKRHVTAKSSLELITQKTQLLSKTTQQTIIYAACIGQQFDLYMLSALLDKTDHEVADELKEAIHEHLVQIELNSLSSNRKGLLPRTIYRFVHDQVQQATYSLITLHEKQEIQLAIGYFLLEKLSAEEVENRIFEIVNHFNAAKDLIDVVEEKTKVARLNLQAGKKAKRATAYGVAYAYFEAGLGLLEEGLWNSDYALCLDLHLNGAETAYLTHHFQKVEQLVKLMLTKVVSHIERVSVHQITIQSLVFQQKGKEAVSHALKVLKTLGVTFPASYSVVHVLIAYGKSKWMLRGKKPEDLETLPKMKDPALLCAMKVIQSITASAYHALPDLYPLLILKMVKLSIKYGNSAESALAYVTYGAIVNGIETNNTACYQLGRMAINLLQGFNDVGIKERTILIYNLINRQSGEHMHSSLDELKQCYKHGIELGDMEYATYTSNAYCMLLCISGKNLSWAKDEMIRCNHLPSALNQASTTNENEALIQYTANLLDESSDPRLLKGEHFDETIVFAGPANKMQPARLFTCYVFKMHLCYLLEDYTEGLKNLTQATLYMNTSRGMVLEPVFYFYASLIHFAQYKTTKGKVHMKQGVHFKNKLKKWAQQVPINYQHRYLLAEAEYYNVSGQHEWALASYDKAIKQAQETHFIQDEALAHELVAHYWDDRGQKNAANIYLLSAIEMYKKWGCTMKVRRLETLVAEQGNGTLELVRMNTSKTNANVAPSLDMATILKASTTLSSEVVFDKLLEKLMKFVIENAGAQAGYFIIDWGGKLVIEARQSVEDHKSVKLNIPLEESTLLPKTIVEHVFHFKKDVVLQDAQLENAFSSDPAIAQHKIRSVLCIPALNQGKLVGVLYLENNLMSGAFNKHRVELLKLLSGQIAVSIENSILYENLEQKVQERTIEIQVQKEEIQKQKQLVEEKSKFKEQFFANMSHEIRTPMTAIIGMSELIFDTPLNEKQTEYAKGIKYSSENLLAIINDILDYAKIESGKFTFVTKPFQLRDRITRLTYIVKQLAEEKGIAFTTTLDPAIPQQLIGDPLRLHQILLNLVSNAIKFTEKGTVSVTVNQQSANESSVVLSFTVRDTGMGIAEEKLQFIFETFSRIEDELHVPGTGLGLFIAKKLVEEQGGAMTVSSKLKEGTAFQFTLPFKRSHVLVSEEDEQDDVVLTGTRILLVEDTVFNQVVAEEILKKIIQNPFVIIASNGKEALEKLEEHTVDIVLMDIKMPVMDGYTASKEIRLRKGLETIPILAFTSNANPGEAEKCKAAGMNDYITKPIESKKLKQKIAKLLGVGKEMVGF